MYNIGGTYMYIKISLLTNVRYTDLSIVITLRRHVPHIIHHIDRCILLSAKPIIVFTSYRFREKNERKC